MDEGRALVGALFMGMGVVTMAYVAQVIQAQVTPTQYPYGGLWWSPAGLIMNIDWLEEGLPTYVGEALPGTGDDEPGWRIYRYELEIVDEDYVPIRVRYAEGNTYFDKVWDLRAEYTYM